FLDDQAKREEVFAKIPALAARSDWEGTFPDYTSAELDYHVLLGALEHKNAPVTQRALKYKQAQWKKDLFLKNFSEEPLTPFENYVTNAANTFRYYHPDDYRYLLEGVWYRPLNVSLELPDTVRWLSHFESSSYEMIALNADLTPRYR